jgi:predicted O-methyltransferase YrrM
MLMNSKEASEDFPNESVDFCYIDANHNYNDVKEDISLWYPKIKKGGILAGHDWDAPGEPDYPWRHTVQRAVKEFILSSKGALKLSLVSESDGTPWSWYIIKP